MVNKNIKNIFILLVSITSSLFSINTFGFEKTGSSDNKSTIVIYVPAFILEKDNENSDLLLYTHIDEKRAKNIRIAEYLIYQLDPGEHEVEISSNLAIRARNRITAFLTASWKTMPLHLITKPGHVYYLRFSFGIARPYHIGDVHTKKYRKFELVSKEIAEYELDQLNLTNPDKLMLDKLQSPTISPMLECVLTKKKTIRFCDHTIQFSQGEYESL